MELDRVGVWIQDGVESGNPDPKWNWKVWNLEDGSEL